MIHRFPFICIAFDIASEAIDVNVHPNKMELKFDNDRLMYDVIKSEIRSVLLKQDLIPEVAVDKSRKPAYESNKKGPQPFEIKRRVMEEKAEYNPVEPKSTISKPSESRPTELKTSELKPLPFVDKTIEDTPEVKQENASSPVKVVEPKAEIKPIPVKNEDPKVESKPISVKNEEPKDDAKSVPVEVEDAKPDANVDSEPVTKNVQQTFYETPLLKEEAKPYHKVIGQLFRTYWLIEYDNKLFIMDQHAAHEKVNYERFMKRYKAHEGRYTQVVNPPIIVSLTPKEIDGYERFKDYFYDMGFDIEHFGGDEYSIHGVPTDMFGIADKEAFITLIDEVCEDIKDHDSDTIIINIATKACKASIKGGQKISYEEVDSLINQLMECDSPFTCPHGRPTLISMTKNEIEKKFKRIQDKEEGRLF
jgi:DNA mismatch repair protein MutL